jgi:hypothetical protein
MNHIFTSQLKVQPIRHLEYDRAVLGIHELRIIGEVVVRVDQEEV